MSNTCKSPADFAAMFATLRRSRICEGLQLNQLEQVAARVRPVRCSAGDALCRVGEAGESMFVLSSGRMKVSVPGHDEQSRVLAYLGPGDHFGELALLDAGRRTADVTAEVDSELLVLERDGFRRLFDEVPQVAKNLLRALGVRFRGTLAGKRRGLSLRAVALVRTCRCGADVLPLVARELTARDERVVVLSDRSSERLAPHCPVEPLGPRNGDPTSATAWKSRIDRLLDSNDRVLVDVDLSAQRSSLAAILDACDENLWLVDATDEADARSAWSDLQQSEASVASRGRVVWLLAHGEQAGPRADPAWTGAHRDLKLPLPDGGGTAGRLQRQGLDRLVRHLRGVSLGLVLGGGAARGMAHFGVARALDRAGISFDMIAGTSSGAMVAIGYAGGYEPSYGVRQFGATLSPPRWLRLIPGGDRWYLPLMYRTGAWDRLLRPYFHDWTLEQLLIPCSAVAVDLITGHQVVRQRGDAIHALLESINLPVIARPICRDGMVLVDGGVLNNLPADVLAGQGADFIVGVNVTAKLPQCFAGNRPGMPAAQMKRGGMLETLLRMFEIHDHELNAVHTRMVDLLIEPETAAFSLADFTKANELADAGEAAAEAVIPRLIAMLSELERPTVQSTDRRR